MTKRLWGGMLLWLSACGSAHVGALPVAQPTYQTVPYTGQTVSLDHWGSGEYFYGFQDIAIDAQGNLTRTIYDGLTTVPLGPRPLPAAWWDSLKQTLVRINLFACQDTYASNCEDCAGFSLQLTVDGRTKKTVWSSGSSAPPTPVTDLIDPLDCLSFYIPCDASTACDPNTLVHPIAAQPVQDCNGMF